VRHQHFGEVEYEQSERMIQQLLAEAGRRGIDQKLVSPHASGAEAAADWSNLKSSETYLGAERTETFASPAAPQVDQRRRYSPPARLSLNQWALAGEWIVGWQSIAASRANGRIVFRFHARDEPEPGHGTAGRGTAVRFPDADRRPAAGRGARRRRRRAGLWPGYFTADVQPDRQPDAIADRLFEDRISRCGRGGVRVYVR
jgi:hypothetical protein